MHPFVRCQCLGGIPEDERRAFLFTNVVNSAGRHLDIPVVIGALAASPRIYAIGMGRNVEEIGKDWLHAIANPIAPIVVSSPACQEVIITGDELRKRDGGLASLPVPIATPVWWRDRSATTLDAGRVEFDAALVMTDCVTTASLLCGRGRGRGR
jgi:hypothetical protein